MRATGQHEVQNNPCCACCRAILHERPTDYDGRRHKSVRHAQAAHQQQDCSSLPTQCRLVQNAGDICGEFLKKGPTAFQNELKAFCASATITLPPLSRQKQHSLPSLLHSKSCRLSPLLHSGGKTPDRFIAASAQDAMCSSP